MPPAVSTLEIVFFDSSSVFGQLAQESLAYGELTYNNGAFGLLKDVDIYDLGTLSTGYYAIGVDDFTWGFSNFDSGSVSSFSLLNSFGQTLDTKYSTFANIDFSVTSPGQYYVMISGPVGLDAQYTVSYERTGDLVTNNLSIFSQATYYGSTEVGNSIAATVAGLPDSFGGIRMALRVTELARAGMTPDWMPGAVPRCVPRETRENQHGVRAVTEVIRTERVLSRGKWRSVDVLHCPVIWRPHPEQIASARRGYDDWTCALKWIRGSLRDGGLLSEIELTILLPRSQPWHAYQL